MALTVEDVQRCLLRKLTAGLPDPLRGYVFGFGLVVTDHLLKGIK